mgnify:CR=1 FL=1
MKLIYTIIKVIILLLFLLLAVINTDSVAFHYLPGQKADLPLIVVLFGAFVIGILFGRLLALRSENNRLRAEVKKHAHLSEKDLAAPVPQQPVPQTTAPTKQPVQTPKP